MKISIRTCVPLLFLCFTCTAFGQGQGKPFALTVDNIMRGPELIGYIPRSVHWSQDSKRVYFEWKKAGEPKNKEFSHYVVNADGSGLRLLPEEEEKLLPPAGGDISPDKRYTVYTEEGDIFLYDHATKRKRQITATSDFENSPRFMPDGKRIVFERQGNLYLVSMEDGSLRQVTDIRRGGAPPADKESSGTSQDVVKKTERELFDTIREAAKQREEQEARRKKQEKEKRKPFYLSGGQNAFNMRLSPDGTYVSLSVSEREGGAKSTGVPNYITESGYTEEISGRSKVGDLQGRSRMAVLNVETGESKWVTFTPPAITAVGIKGKDRPLSWFNWQWSKDGKRAVVLARAVDNKDFWILGVDPATGKTTVLSQNHDDAWVGGPGGFTMGFLADDRHVYFVSEKSGFSQLYFVSTEGGEPIQLTQGKFEVSDVRLSEDKTHFYFLSSEAGFTERHLYSMPVEGGARTRITRLSGDDDTREYYTLSSNERTLAMLRSTSNRPPELFLMPNRQDGEAVQVTHSPTEEWLSYPWIEPPIVTFPARDGATVTARLYKPAKWRRGGPAVLFVHGAGYLQNAHSWWSHYYPEYMFHHLLMERGYLVLDADYRGSAGYGRDWRTGIYRHMGGKDLEDEVDGARWLVATYGVSPKRIGIYGGSYGGFITLMAMFTTPDVFAAGAALRPVTDWAHYNHGYTANILNEPQNDPEAYRRSSPIFFAEGLKGALLICHGMVDTNVHFQDSVRLAQRLIELRKENWELAAFPVENHGFTEATSWADEYKRILKLFETNLKR
jgi:dipeptidyl aminopeptidase/acylaminoacyl peptidase